MNIDNRYLISGIDITKRENGYRVFTIPTQHFDIVNLDELTNERFDDEIKRQEKYEKDSSELFRVWYEKNF
jgi:hypothetical protein